jgi:hypothetical protein
VDGAVLYARQKSVFLQGHTMSRAKAGCWCLLAALLLGGAPALIGAAVGPGQASISPATGGDFSCDLSMVNVPRQYVVGQPVILIVELTNHTSREVRIQDNLRHYPPFSLDIIGPTGRPLELKATWDYGVVEGLLKQPTFEPWHPRRVRIDAARWYDLSQPGRYSIRPKWQALLEPRTDVTESKAVTIAVVPPEQAEVVKLIHSATFVTKRVGSGLPAQCKLVEMGEAAVPALVEWLEIVEASGGPDWSNFASMVDVLSQIGSPRALEFLTPERAHGNLLNSALYRTHLLERVEIWQGENRFERLVKLLDSRGDTRKWAIFKLGVLGDPRAIEPLDRIAAEDKDLDIRETAKDSLAHLRNPSIKVRYRFHWTSEQIELTAAESFRIGEPVKIRCKITGGEFGSRYLAEFSQPCWHCLPCGHSGPDPNGAQPFCLAVDRRHDNTYDHVRPLKQLRPSSKEKAGKARVSNDYVDIAELGSARSFTLKPGESRLYESADLRQAFPMAEPGEYRICIAYYNYVLSNFLTIHILPAASGSASVP